MPDLSNALWIGPAETPGPIVLAAALRFRLDRAATIRAHVTADERYVLYVDGRRVGRGPERGEVDAWRFETLEISLDAGEHVIVARVQRLGELAPFAQTSVSPAFLLHADAPFDELLSTSKADWQIATLDGYRFEWKSAAAHFVCVGASTIVDGRSFAWGYERGDVPNLAPVARLGKPASVDAFGVLNGERGLVPATLPPMLDARRTVGRVRYVGATLDHPRADQDRPDEHADWQRLVAGEARVVVPARTQRRVIVDLENYYCGYPELRVTGGNAATITIGLAESLYEQGDKERKGDRNAVVDKDWYSLFDRFHLDGGTGRLYESLWWNAGRFVAIDVQTADEPLELLAFALNETRYPIEPASDFQSSDPRLAAVIPMAVRSLQMCMHETYVDCPHYEQLMYVGDSRLQALTTYVTSSDDRLARKSIELFDHSRDRDGLTRARFPSRAAQTIPPFSLWWISMVHDHAMWRDDATFIRERLPGVRAVLDAFLARLDPSTGLPMPLEGWNFVDWVPGWNIGIPPDADREPNATIALQLVLALQSAAALERFVGEPEMAERFTHRAAAIVAAVRQHFFDAGRKLLAENLSKTHFAEHANSLARVADAKTFADLHAPPFDADVSRATIYFSHYYLDACAAAGRYDAIIDRLKLWFDLPKHGFVTTPESPEPSRSDCHGWGAHPLFHYATTICGIRPASPGFKSVQIDPLLGPLTQASVSVPHPQGMIHVRLKRAAADAPLHAAIILPPAVAGTFIWDGSQREIAPGGQEFTA